MKKLLLGSAAVALGLAAIAGPASAADGVSLDVSGHFKGYATWNDQDGSDVDFDGDGTSDDERSLDILRETEVHLSGETTLDNGLTVGMHIETDIDQDGVGGAADEFNTEEAYAYFSGAWGRMNFGKEDGAGYLLQVAAPSADSNLDGLRQWVTPVNYTLHSDNNATTPGILSDLSGDLSNGGNGGGLTAIGADLLRFDYDMAVTGYDNKVTYMTPVFNGFQAGVSYTPELFGNSRGTNGVNTDDIARSYGDAVEVGARWEGMLGELGVAFGGGYTTVSIEDGEDIDGDGTDDLDDRQAWNVGLDMDWGPFGMGVAYTEDDLGTDRDADRDTLVVGVDYTTGPFKLGASYYAQDQELEGIAAVDSAINPGAGTSAFFGGGGDLSGGAAGFVGEEMETDRYSGGVVYTYGPGMTFRGSVSYIEHEFSANLGQDDLESTSVLVGTQINF